MQKVRYLLKLHKDKKEFITSEMTMDEIVSMTNKEIDNYDEIQFFATNDLNDNLFELIKSYNPENWKRVLERTRK